MSFRSVLSAAVLIALVTSTFESSAQQRQFFVSASTNLKERADIYYQAAGQEQSILDSKAFYRQALEYYSAFTEGAPRDSIYLDCLIKMADCAFGADEEERQLEYLNQALALNRELFHASDPSYADAVLRVASQCMDAGDDVQALKLLRSVSAVCEKSPTLKAKWLGEVSSIELRAGRYRKSVNMRREAVKLSKNDRALYISALTQMGDVSIPLVGARYYKKAYEEYVSTVFEQFNKKSELSRARYWGSVLEFFNKVFSNAGLIPEQAYDAALLTKGMLLNTSIDFQEFVAASGDSLAIDYQQERNRLTAQGAPAILTDSLDNLIIKRLDGRSLPFKDKNTIRWQQVRDALGEDDLAIEFFQTGDNGYGALLIRKEWRKPKYVQLESPEQPWSNQIRRFFPMSDKGRVFFSPAGVMNILPVEYAPCDIWRLDDKSMADVYKLYRLSSTRELVERKHKRAGLGRTGLYGGVDYSAYEEDVAAALEGISLSRRLADLEFEQRLEDPDDKAYFDVPQALRYSAVEVHAIDTLLYRNAIDADIFTGVYASEEAVKEYSPRDKILHFATHGFYVSPSDIEKGRYKYYTQLFSSRPDLLLDPLYRSGLHMAGAAEAWNNGEGGGALADGVLTAHEISLLDLSGVDLVVLSACDSGLGDVTGEGVYGLPRAFKKAGAGAVLMSLKPVGDLSTQCFMQRFYQNMLLGEDCQTAFNQTRTALGNKDFILLDALPDNNSE